MIFTIHNDAPIVPPNMLRLLWATTNRLTRSGQVLGAQQRISVYDALLAVTRYAAIQAFEEQEKGTISAGKLADLTVLSADPTAIDPGDLLRLKVERTWSHGRLVFARAPDL